MPDIPPKPDKPCYCYNCGSIDYWWRESNNWGYGEWLCGKCHPQPNQTHQNQQQGLLKDK